MKRWLQDTTHRMLLDHLPVGGDLWGFCPMYFLDLTNAGAGRCAAAITSWPKTRRLAHFWCELNAEASDTERSTNTAKGISSGTRTANPLASAIFSSPAAGNDTKPRPTQQSSRQFTVAPVGFSSNLALTLPISDQGSLLPKHVCSPAPGLQGIHSLSLLKWLWRGNVHNCFLLS